MSFGWSASDVAEALKILYKIGVSLKDVGGASSDYQQECAFLNSVRATLNLLEAVCLMPLDPDLARNLKELTQQVRGLIDSFLQDVDQRFEAFLGSSSTQRSKWVRAPWMIRWALSTSKQVQRLRNQVHMPLTSINLTLSEQITQTMLQLPPEIQTRVAATVEQALAPRIPLLADEIRALPAAWRQGVAEVTQQTAQNTEVLRNIETLLGGMQLSTDGIRSMVHGLPLLPASSDAVRGPKRQRGDANSRDENLGSSTTGTNFKARLAEVDSMLGSMKSVLNDYGKFETRPSFARSASLKYGTAPVQDILRGIWVLLGLLIQRFLHPVEQFLIVCLRVMTSLIVSLPKPRRLSQIPENGVTFEDALGRICIIPCDYMRSWEHFTESLRVAFRGYPGEKIVQRGLYLLAYSAQPDLALNPKYWNEIIVPGAHLQMSIMVKARVSRQGGQARSASSYYCSLPATIKSKTVLHKPGHFKETTELRIFDSASAMMSKLSDPPPKMAADFTLHINLGNSLEEITAFRRIHLLNGEGDIRKHLNLGTEETRLYLEQKQHPQELSKSKQILGTFSKRQKEHKGRKDGFHRTLWAFRDIIQPKKPWREQLGGKLHYWTCVSCQRT